jgi:error-prone DNA polymerase
VRPITGAEVTLHDGSHVTLLVESAAGYANLCRLLTAAHARTRDRPGELAEPSLDGALLAELNDGLVCLSGCARHGLALRDPNGAAALARAFGRERFFVELQRPYERGDTRRLAALRDLAAALGAQTVATGDAHAHHRRRTALQDVLVAIRCRTSLDGCEAERRGNRESVLLAPAGWEERFPHDRDAVARTAELAERLEFDLTEDLGYRYPDFSDTGEPAIRQLARVCDRAFAERYGSANGLKRRARARLDEELALIDELGLAGFFLLHWEVLELARECAVEVRGGSVARNVLPPGRGRGSSVGSIVCYLTGLSHVDPVRAGLSLGRFLNREMIAVPDIDLDFPRDIREKLIVAVCDRYGREHSALVASYSTYHARGAIRDVGKALGLPFAELERLARLTDGNPYRVRDELAKLPDADAKRASPRWRAFARLCGEIGGLPRHVSQHPGGMVISTRPLVELVPVQPAAMEGRQLCQWDKDSCSDAGFLKIDLLGLGMLSAVEDCVEQIAKAPPRRRRKEAGRASPAQPSSKRGETIDLSRVELDDPAVYEEIQRADTIGVFQIESRAQMQSLLRTRPETLDDLTIQVALVRPGPIQGGAVHPYIERRAKLRSDPSFEPPVDHPSLREPLRDTLGVIVFQDQVLEVAMALAGFSIGEAEGLRRAMSRKRSLEAIEAFRGRFVEGSVARGVDEAVADAVFDKLVGFSGFGFPKSHAAAFGLLAYQSAWLRHHYPAEFLCALLNAQPMGFYPPASLVRDAQRRGVEVRPPDVNLSDAPCALEDEAVRVGLSYVRSLGDEEAKAVAAERARAGPFRGVRELAQRTGLDRPRLEALVASGACDRFGRRRALLWELGFAPRAQTVPGSGGEESQLALPLDPTAATPALREHTEWERMLADYRTTSLSVGVHPLKLLRPHLPAGTLSSIDLESARDRSSVAVAGMAIARQRPATANGVVFMLLEDEHGQVNLIVPPAVYERYRALVRAEPLLLARGRFERVERNRNVLVRELESLGPLARRCADEADVFGSLPAAHHFGHR